MDPYQSTYDLSNPSAPANQSMVGFDWNTLVVDPLIKILNNCIGFIPDLITALYILVFAWVIGKILQIVVAQFLKSIRFDIIADKIGFNDLINSEKSPMMTPSKWCGVVTFWLTICIALVMALSRVRLSVASRWLDDVVSLLIAVFSAVTILILGVFLSEIVSRLVRTSVQKFGVKQSNLYSGFVRFGILLLTLMLTMDQFHVPGQFIIVGVGIICVCLAFTFVIAFGFGGRVWAAKVLDRIY